MTDQTHRTAHQCPTCRLWTCTKQSLIESHRDHPDDVAFRAARRRCRKPATDIVPGQVWTSRRGGEDLQVERGPRPDDRGDSTVLVVCAVSRRRRLIRETRLRVSYRPPQPTTR